MIAGAMGLGAAGQAASGPINAASNGLGNLISGGDWRQSGSEKAAQEFNAGEAQKQRDFEERMSSTAYQRAVKDIEAAGLNPALIYGAGGTPSSTPASSSASSGSGRSGHMQSAMNTLGEVSQLINSVTNARALDHKIDKKTSNITTQRLYNSVGQLVQTLVKQTK